MNRSLSFFFILLSAVIIGLISKNAYAQPLTGIKTIPGDYNSIFLAISDLNTQGVGTGGVTFNIAAGYTETTYDTLVINATGSPGSEIIFQKNGTGANPKIHRTDGGLKETSILGGQGDAVITIQGTDYITFDGIDLKAEQSGIEYGYYLRKASPTDGCKYVTIKNAMIDMNKGASAYVVGIYASNNDPLSSVSTSNGIAITSIGGRHENVTITGNTIQDVFTGIFLRGYNAGAPYDFYDQNFIIGTSGAGNIIRNYAGNTTSEAYGVYIMYNTNPTVSYNTIDNAGSGGTPALNTLYGIFMSSSSLMGNWVSNNNFITLSQGSTSAAHAIYNAQTGTTITINNNTFAYGAFASITASYLIYCSNSTPDITVTGNHTSGTITKTGAGEFDGYYNHGHSHRWNSNRIK